MRQALGPIALAVTLASTACATSPITSSEVRSPAVEATATHCANVESKLRGLLLAPNRPAYADEQGLDLVGTTIRVIIELDSDQSRPSLPAVIERKDGPLLQALVAPDRLCEIGMQPSVRTVRIAYQPEPLDGADRSESR